MTALLWMALVGCGVPIAPTPQPSASKDFPHSTTFAESENHGAVSVGNRACAKCHSLEGLGDPPSCRSCHGAYPHDPTFHSDSHGAAWLATPENCVECHGLDGELEPARIKAGACRSCHRTYPHPEDWELAVNHGAATTRRGGTAACDGCHGVSGAEIPDADCAECHALYPHEEGWLQGGHGAAWVDDPECGEACHDIGSTRSCVSCHDLYPHPTDAWLRVGHMAATQARGEPACASCHDSGLTAPTLPVSCAPSCHGEP